MRRLIAFAILAGTAACVTPVNTVPEPVAPGAPVQYYDLDIPTDLEVRSVDFVATAFTDVSGFEGNTSSTSTGRGFVKVYAAHKRTGEQYLLLYEDVVHRRRPVQVVRFRPTEQVRLP